MRLTLLDVVVLLVAAQRLAELLYAARNTRALRLLGAHEVGAVQYPFFVVLQGAWLVAMLVFIPQAAPANWYLLGFYVALQACRVWVLRALGPRWTTRIIVLPQAQLVRSGPYRFVRHPNYAIVALEVAILPLAFGAVWLAAVFTVLNAVLLTWRIRVEEAALAPTQR